MSREIRAVIFDVDNTLIQSRHGALQALRVASTIISDELKKHGLKFSQSQILRRLRRVERERRAPLSGLVPQRLYDRDVWWKLLLKQLGVSRIQGPWIHRTTLWYWLAYVKGSPPFRDTEPALNRLTREGYKLGIVSDSDGTLGVKRMRIRRLPFRRLFQTVVVAGEDTPRVKPTKAPFLLASKRLGVPPENCAYVGDNPDTDVDGAKAVGMMTILVRRSPYAVSNPGTNVRRTSPTVRINSLRQLTQLLSLLGDDSHMQRPEF